MIKKGIPITANVRSIVKFLRKFHAIIFFLIVSICLFSAIFILLPVTSITSDKSQATNKSIDGSFDENTINKLRNGTNTGASYQPGERTNPFNE